MKAYRLYTEQIAACGVEPLAVHHPRLAPGEVHRQQHAVHDQMLKMRRPFRQSKPYENSRHFECGLCTPPARAGKGAAVGGILLH
jgi:flagellar transcriptional activator FlhC